MSGGILCMYLKYIWKYATESNFKISGVIIIFNRILWDLPQCNSANHGSIFQALCVT